MPSDRSLTRSATWTSLTLILELSLEIGQSSDDAAASLRAYHFVKVFSCTFTHWFSNGAMMSGPAYAVCECVANVCVLVYATLKRVSAGAVSDGEDESGAAVGKKHCLLTLRSTSMDGDGDEEICETTI